MEMPICFIWSNIFLFVFYLFYVIFLSRETFFVLNRIYLLSSVILSTLIPLLIQSPILEVPKISILLADILVVKSQHLHLVNKGFPNWLATLYWFGTAVSGLILLLQLMGVSKEIKSATAGSAFSFWRTKVIDPALPDSDTINQHESIHIEQLHTIDIIFIKLASVFFWCNPVIYLYQHSIRLVHEYLADEYAARRAGSKRQYAMTLFCHNFKVSSDLANTFFSPSQLKCRINMLQKGRSAKRSLWKYAFSAPLMFFLLLFSSSRPANFSASRDKERVDSPATYPGGFPAFSDYVVHHARHIADTEGKLLLSFTIEMDGRISNESVIKGLDPSTNAEAIRLIHSSPRWRPALKDGNPVRSSYRLPVTFHPTHEGLPE